MKIQMRHYANIHMCVCVYSTNTHAHIRQVNGKEIQSMFAQRADKGQGEEGAILRVQLDVHCGSTRKAARNA